MPPLYTPRFWAVSTAHFFFLMGFWMFVLLPLRLEELGASESGIGMLMAVEPAAAVLIRPAIGGMLFRRGRRWVILRGGLLNLFAVGLYLGVRDAGAGMFLVRVLHGIGIGVLFPAFFTYVTDITPARRRTEGLAVFGASAMLPTALAPLLGEELFARAGFAGLFLAASGFSLAALAFGSILPEPDSAESAPMGSFWRFAKEPARRSVWITTLVFSLAMSSYAAFLAPYAHSRGFDRVGVFFLCYSVAAISLRMLGRGVPDQIGPRRILPPALATLGAGLFLLSGLQSISGMVAAGLLCGMGHGYLFPVLGSLAVENTDFRSRADAMSFFTAVFDLGQMVGPAALGLLAETAGYPRMFFATMMLVFLTMSFWLPSTWRSSAHA